MPLLSNKTLKQIIIMAFIVAGAFTGNSCVLLNNPPVINGLESDKEWVELSGSTQIRCFASDEDGDALAYTWEANDGAISGQGNVATWYAPLTSGYSRVSVTVYDNNGGEANKELLLLTLQNQPPMIESLTSENTGCGFGIPNTLECIAIDPEREELTYEWTAESGKFSQQKDNTVIWISPEIPGDHVIKVIVKDGRGGETNAKISITVRRP